MKVLIIDQSGRKVQRIAEQLLQSLPNLRKNQVFYFQEIWGNITRGNLQQHENPESTLLTKTGLTGKKLRQAVEKFIAEYHKDNIMVFCSTRLGVAGYGASIACSSEAAAELYMSIMLAMNKQESEEGEAKVFCCVYGCHGDTEEMGKQLRELWLGKFAKDHEFLPFEIFLPNNIAWVNDRDSDVFTTGQEADPELGVLALPKPYVGFLKSLK